jgi:hypothetical protein
MAAASARSTQLGGGGGPDLEQRTVGVRRSVGVGAASHTAHQSFVSSVILGAVRLISRKEQSLTSACNRRTRLMALAAAGVLTVAGLGPAGAAGHGARVPYHEVGLTHCLNGGLLRAFPPRVMRPTSRFIITARNPELVRWSPNLYRWKGGSWRLYDSSKPWYFATTMSYGYVQIGFDFAWKASNYAGIVSSQFTGLRPGRYRVRNYMYWARTGANHAQWSPVYCTYR